MPDPLIDEVVAAVAPGYRELPIEDVAGIVLMRFGGDLLAPFALEDPMTPDREPRQLGAPRLGKEAPIAELRARVEADEGLLNVYLLALATRVHELVGIPVLVMDIEMPIDEQERRQAKLPPAEDPLAGMDVLVSLKIDEHRTAAVTLREGLWMYASARAADPEKAHSIGRGPIEIGLDPHVVAGRLPRGAAGVRVQDHAGAWHAAATGRGGWLCVLPQRSRGDEQPPFEYLDAGEWDVHTTLEPATLAAAFEERLIRVHGYNTAGAKQRLRAIMPEPLPGTLDGNPVTLELMTFPEPWERDQGWVAVLHGDAYTVTVQCGGAPPDEVDLRTHSLVGTTALREGPRLNAQVPDRRRGRAVLRHQSACSAARSRRFVPAAVTAGLISYALADTDLPWWAVALVITAALSIVGALLSAWEQRRRAGPEPPTR